jgi:hypothetical protein
MFRFCRNCFGMRAGTANNSRGVYQKENMRQGQTGAFPPNLLNIH